MEFSEFVSGYRSGTVHVHVDRSSAMRVCSHSPALPRHFRNRHLLGKNVSLFLILGGFASLIWLPWWAGVGAVVLGFVIAPRVHQSAAQMVLQHSLEDEAFFRHMLETGVVEVEPSDVGSDCHRE